MQETQQNTQAASIDTEHTLGSEETGAGFFWLVVDLTNMANGDVLILRAKMKVKAGGTARTVARGVFSDAQEETGCISIPMPNVHGVTFTLEQTDGTGRNYDWSIRKG